MIQWIKLALPIYFTIHFSKMLGYQKKIKFILKRDTYIMKKKSNQASIKNNNNIFISDKNSFLFRL